jgi:hypothetical protein
MMPRARNNRAACYASATSKRICPVCGDCSLIRVRRRIIDRLLTLFLPVHRYRCRHYACQWKGNLRVPRHVADATIISPR